MTYRRLFLVSLCLVLAAACSKDSPSTPSVTVGATTTVPPTSTTTAKLTAPAPDTPGDGEQLNSLRPTLTVKNGTSDQPSGTRTYEFQVSDRSDLSLTASTRFRTFTVVVSKPGVPEGAGGSTSLTLDSDLQPTTRFYWRSRMVQGAVTSEWSATRSFKSQLVGYNRPGELYDPLVNGKTVADALVKRVAFVPGKGIQIADQDSYVQYRLQQTLTSGEFSVDVENVSDNPKSSDPNTEKLKIFSMTNTLGDIYQSPYLCNVQYRGFNGNPDHALSFKCLFNGTSGDHKLEPDLGARLAAVKHLNPAGTYMFRATWGSFFRMQVLDGGVGGINGSGTADGGRILYDYQVNTTGTYAPSPHYAYLGVNNSSSETGSWPGAIYRNLWIGSGPRPSSRQRPAGRVAISTQEAS